MRTWNWKLGTMMAVVIGAMAIAQEGDKVKNEVSVWYSSQHEFGKAGDIMGTNLTLRLPWVAVYGGYEGSMGDGKLRLTPAENVSGFSATESLAWNEAKYGAWWFGAAIANIPDKWGRETSDVFSEVVDFSLNAMYMRRHLQTEYIAPIAPGFPSVGDSDTVEKSGVIEGLVRLNKFYDGLTLKGSVNLVDFSAVDNFGLAWQHEDIESEEYEGMLLVPVPSLNKLSLGVSAYALCEDGTKRYTHVAPGQDFANMSAGSTLKGIGPALRFEDGERGSRRSLVVDFILLGGDALLEYGAGDADGFRTSATYIDEAAGFTVWFAMSKYSSHSVDALPATFTLQVYDQQQEVEAYEVGIRTTGRFFISPLRQTEVMVTYSDQENDSVLDVSIPGLGPVSHLDSGWDKDVLEVRLTKYVGNVGVILEYDRRCDEDYTNNSFTGAVTLRF